MIAFLKGWRTRIWAIFLAVMGAVVAMDPNLIVQLVGKENQGWVFIAIAAITAILREFSTTPAGETEHTDA